MSEIKQVIVVRKDLNMSPGKIAAQVAHASISAVFAEMVPIPGEQKLALDTRLPAYKWQQGSQVKIILTVDSKEELLEIYDKAQELLLPRFIVKDEGRTELAGPTYTTVAVGPDYPEQIDLVTGHLKLL